MAAPAERDQVPTPRALTREEGRALFDRAARRELRMSGEQFVSAYRSGQLASRIEQPEIMRVAMLLPFVEEE